MIDGDGIVIVEDSSGEWMGVYVNEVLRDQGHGFTGLQMLELLGIPHQVFEQDTDSNYPDDLEELFR